VISVDPVVHEVEAVFHRLRTFSELVVLPHSVFALPFALASLLAATGGRPPLRVLFWVVACMVLARTAAMAYNRLLDADVDVLNPRTQGRPLPSGRMTPGQVRTLTWVSGLLFVLAAGRLNPLCFKLSPVALAVVLFYSHTKRFTWASHLVLGLALGVAPPAAWIAATGAFAPEPLWLTGAVVCFVAGFDILYATQDRDFDASQGLHSWVVRFGLPASLASSRILHALMLGFLAGFGAHLRFPDLYYAGVALLGALLFHLHRTQYRLDPGTGGFRLGPGMMKMSGWVAVLYFLVVGVTLWS
jgi:4-hydroxybenzoate polyprenyltransferase